MHDAFELFGLLADLSKQIEEGSITPRAIIVDSLGMLLSPLLASQTIGIRGIWCSDSVFYLTTGRPLMAIAGRELRRMAVEYNLAVVVCCCIVE